MATVSFSSTPDNSTDATWRAWGQGIHNAIAGMATLVQTTDTGQANWTTATRSGGAYEMWRFNDSLQATAPVYIKISFLNGPSISVSVGSGTNGSGTLTGNQVSDSGGWSAGNSTSATTCYMSSTPSRLTMGLTASLIYAIERLRDNTGAEISTGVTYISPGSVQYAGQSGSPGTTSGHYDLQCIRHEGPNLIGTQTTVFTMNVIGQNYQVQNPPLSFLWYWSSDIGAGATLSCTLYGVAHTYVNFIASNGGQFTGGMSSNMLALMLYE